MRVNLLGNINHDVAHWPFCFPRDPSGLNTRPDEPMPLTTKTLAEGLMDMGIGAMELAPAVDYDLLAGLNMVNAMGMVDPFPGIVAPFVRGFNSPKYQPDVIAATIAEIDRLAEHGWPNVIAFWGYGEDPVDHGIPIGIRIAPTTVINGLRQVAKHAAVKGVTVCLEHLNTRDASHPMKGHPGYQGDNLDIVADTVKAVGSPNVKLLFDVFHVQMMHGDVIGRLVKLLQGGLVGHVHTAGCPGRGEIDLDQELNYPAIMRALVRGGYKGYVGHEHIPTFDSKWASIQMSVEACDV